MVTDANKKQTQIKYTANDFLSVND